MKSQKAKKATVALAALCMSLVVGMTPIVKTMALQATDEKYTTDYSTIAEANEAAEKLSNETTAEGSILLKNKDNALPMVGNEWVTVFGSSDYANGIKSGGFSVFNLNSTKDFTPAQKKSFKAYSDAAIIVVSTRSAGEGRTSGYVTDEVEDNKFAGEENLTYADGTPFRHKSLGTSADGTEYKHSLEIGDATEELIKYCSENFKKVIIMLTTPSTMEVGILEVSDKVDAILSVGTPGSGGWQGTAYGGYEALGGLLNGTINPSGKTVDLWAWDFTANTTWANDGNSGKSFTSAADEDAYYEMYSGVSVTSAMRTEEGKYAVRKGHTSSDVVKNYYVVEYEEDIYSGYRYYETAAAEAALGNYDGFKYEHSVVYPFGYGLSYTTFEKHIVGSSISDWGKRQANWTNGGKMTIKVEVKNTGSVAGKEVVEIYGHAPYYKNGVAKTENVLVGFEKTKMLKPGEKQIIEVEVKISDLASYDYLDANGNGKTTYELDRVAATDEKGNALHDSVGHYELRLQSDSHTVDDTLQLPDLAETIILAKSSTGKEISNLFSGKDIYNTLSYDPATQKTLVEEGKMRLLSRADFAGTFPDMRTGNEFVRSQDWYTLVDTYADWEADAYGKDGSFDQLLGETAAKEDDSDLPWAVSDAEKAAMEQKSGVTWRQGEENGLKFRDLAGVEYDSNKQYTINGQAMNGMAAWEKLLNEMTWDEMVYEVMHGAYHSLAIESIEKPNANYMDSALVVDQELRENGFNWGDCGRYASTWNKDIMYRRGVISGCISILSESTGPMSDSVGMDGWYAPAIDLHRSPFGGRSSEYFSEDPYISGVTAGEIVAGMASKGVLCTIKHCPLNENETQRRSLFTYVSEQAAREVYFKAFEIVLEDYQCAAIMTAYNNIGDIHSNAHYNFMNELVRGEWGFNGFATSDAVSPCNDFFTMDLYLRTGNSLLLSNLNTDESTEFCGVSGTYDAASNTVKLKDGTVSNTQWYVVRQAMLQILYAEVNSAINANGYDLSGFVGGALKNATQGESYNQSLGFNVNGTCSYEITSGELPAGLSFKNQALTGTPTEAGTYTFTVKLSIDTWVKKSATFTVTVESAFSLDENAAPEYGKAYDAYVVSSIFTTDVYTKGITYALANGSELPAGLTMSEDGHITGTPEVTGEYQVLIAVTGEKEGQQGGGFPGGGFPGGSGGPGGASSNKTTLHYVLTLNIGGEKEEILTLTETQLKAFIEAATESKLTEEQVNAIVEKATAGQLTEEQVKTLIRDALAENNKAGSGCNGAIGMSSLALITMVASFAAFVALRKKEK